MPLPDELSTILDRIAKNQHTAAELEVLRQWLSGGRQWVSQSGKYAVNLGQGQDIQVGDRIYQGADAETIREIFRTLLQELKLPPESAISPPAADELVQQVRSRLHDDIQRLHGTMPLWGVDHWVPLGELFVDVNILEEVSSNRRSELADLWQDFSQNPGYRSLDRMGLGKERQRVSGLAVLDRNTNLMVVGKPGSGKTTYLQRVVTECNAGNLQAHRIPVLIRLREFVEDGRGVDYAVERYLERCWRLSAVEVQLVLEAGRSLVLLDGLDEVTGADGQAIAKQIKRFARDYPQVQVIVTCRTQNQESRFERFDYVEVADFNEPQVRAFAEHWFQTVCGDVTAGQAKAKAFLVQLFREENKPIRELAITPTLLSLTCAVFQQTGKFYSKRSRLYEEGLELLLEKWDERRGIGRYEIHPDFSPSKELELLSYLAVKKFEQEQYVLFEQAEIEGYIAEFLGIGVRESRGVLRAIEAQHGLLIERSQKVWSFSHLTFQEYLVAKWFCDRLESLDSLAQKIKYRYWAEVISLALGMLDYPDRLFLLIKSQIDNLLNESSLQQFLLWIDKKTSYLKTTCKKAGIRAFYFAIACRISVYEYDIRNSPILESRFFEFRGHALDRHVTKYMAGYNENSSSNGYDLSNVYCLADNLGIRCESIEVYELERDYTLAATLDMLRLLSRSTAEEVETNLLTAYSIIMIENGFGPHTIFLVGKTLLEYILLSEIGQFTIMWKETLEKHWYDFDEWWTKDGEKWIATLRKILIQRCDFGEYWELNDEQKYSLNLYYNANLFLIECVNQSNTISVSIKEEIEEALLLPIAEIENRQREKVE